MKKIAYEAHQLVVLLPMMVRERSGEGYTPPKNKLERLRNIERVCRDAPMRIQRVDVPPQDEASAEELYDVLVYYFQTFGGPMPSIDWKELFLWGVAHKQRRIAMYAAKFRWRKWESDIFSFCAANLGLGDLKRAAICADAQWDGCGIMLTGGGLNANFLRNLLYVVPLTRESAHWRIRLARRTPRCRCNIQRVRDAVLNCGHGGDQDVREAVFAWADTCLGDPDLLLCWHCGESERRAALLELQQLTANISLLDEAE